MFSELGPNMVYFSNKTHCIAEDDTTLDIELLLTKEFDKNVTVQLTSDGESCFVFK